MYPKFSPTHLYIYIKNKIKKKSRKKNCGDAKAPFYPYILYCVTVYKCLFVGEFADKKIVCRAFAKVEFSFSFPLSYKKKKERKKEKKDRSSGIRQGAIFLKFLFMVL